MVVVEPADHPEARVLVLVFSLILTACSSPAQRCETALDELNDCFASAGATTGVNTSLCDDADADDLDDIECLEEAVDDATCTTTEGLQALMLKMCSCDPSSCTSGGTDTGTYTQDTGTSKGFR